MSYNQYYPTSEQIDFDGLQFVHIDPKQLRYVKRQSRRQSQRKAHNRKALRKMRDEQ